MNALLMSMPGTPIIYYGDEIGMGDNIYLGDRNGVRTPMQWSADRNAGFSEADSAALYSPAHRRSAVRLPHGERRGAGAHADVAAALDARGSSRVRQAVQGVRARHVRAARRRRTGACSSSCAATQDEVDPLREQPRRASRSTWSSICASSTGWSPIELWSGQAFPPIGDAAVPADAGGRDFLWFRLQPPGGPERLGAIAPVGA